jgi:NTP pyrophosphatase (non-canonical NTP hydrolase)
MNLNQIQKEQDEWSKRNFDNKKPYQPILGATEEVGELAHAYLKMEQGIRGTKADHELAMKDAIGDCCIFLMDFCNQMGWSFEEIIDETWEHVKKRDWKEDKMQDTRNLSA